MFPKSASVVQLKLIRESIASERDQRLSRSQTVPASSQPVVAPVSSQGGSAAAISIQAATPAPSQPPSLVRKTEGFFLTCFLGKNSFVLPHAGPWVSFWQKNPNLFFVLLWSLMSTCLGVWLYFNSEKVAVQHMHHITLSEGASLVNCRFKVGCPGIVIRLLRSPCLEVQT